MQLKVYRESIDITRSEMARQLRVDVTTCWRWEAGFIMPTPENIRRIQTWSRGHVRLEDWVREDVRSGGEA